MEPSVTFIMAARDAAHTVRQSVISALAQEYNGVVKLIAVDDGSNDATLEILHEFDNIMVLTHSASMGRAASRNLALEQVATEFVAIQDADDVSLPNRLRSSVRALQSADATVVGTQLSWTDPRTGPYRGAVWPLEHPAAEKLLIAGRMPIAHPSMMARTDALCSVGGYSDKYPVAEDLDLCLRIRGRNSSARFVSAASSEVIYRRRRVAKLSYTVESAHWRNVVLDDNGLDRKRSRRSDPYVGSALQWGRQGLKALLRAND